MTLECCTSLGLPTSELLVMEDQKIISLSFLSHGESDFLSFAAEYEH